MDTETKQVISLQDTLKGLTEHDGWGIVRSMLIDEVMKLQSIDDIDTSSPEKVVIDIKSRQNAARILFEWLKNIEGTVEQSKTNTSLLPKENSYIVRG